VNAPQTRQAELKLGFLSLETLRSIGGVGDEDVEDGGVGDEDVEDGDVGDEDVEDDGVGAVCCSFSTDSD